MLKEQTWEILELLGITKDSERDKRLIDLMKVMLSMQNDGKVPLRFGEVYGKLLETKPENIPSRTCVHNDIKELLEIGFVRPENARGTKKRYIIDVNTITDGLERLKETRVTQLQEQREQLEKMLKGISAIDCSSVAQQIVFELSGRHSPPTTRFVKGIEGMHRILTQTIVGTAGEGDIIRVYAVFFRPLVKGGIERTRKFIEAAIRGADVRYMVTKDLFKILHEKQSDLDLNHLLSFLAHIKQLRNQGIKFEARISLGENTYNHISLNREKTALILTERPITTTLITRDFNPDLIDNVVDSFDRMWVKAIPFHSIPIDKIPELIQSAQKVFEDSRHVSK